MSKKRKGIILAGGAGKRLYPLTMGVSKQLLPIYDKPMIYHPLTVLMLAKIRDILIIVTPRDRKLFEYVLEDGKQWGITLKFKEQQSPDGLSQAYILAEEFLDGAPSAMILGDNLFFGDGLSNLLQRVSAEKNKSTVFGYHVADPERYGVIEFDQYGKVKELIEKPKVPPSNFALTGLYFMDHTASDRAKKIKPSERGELEITSLLETYLFEDKLSVERMGRGFAWLDTGTYSSLLDAGNFVRTLTERQNLQVGSPDEVAFQMGWISSNELKTRAEIFESNSYGAYLNDLLKAQ